MPSRPQRVRLGDAAPLVRWRRSAAKSPWTPVVVLGGFAALLGFYSWYVGGVPLVTKVYNRKRAAGVLPQLSAFLDWWERSGPFPISVGVDGGVRDQAAVDRLYAKGRTVSSGIDVSPERPLGRTVTNATTNVNTAHGHAAALDLWPVNAAGRPLFDTKDPAVLAKYREIGRLAKEHGFEWGGDWTSFKDWPHIQIRGWAALPVVGSKAVV